MDRVGKLLAQAEGTDNEHEAAAFVERAQQLATEHAVDLELARARQRERQERGSQEPLVQEQLQVGAKGRRGNRHRVLLFVAVAAVNDVLVNVAHDSTYVLGFGHRTDLEVVERLWSSLAVQMTTSAQRRMDAGEHRAAQIAGQSWRVSFYDGFIEVIGDRLQRARQRALAHAAEQAVLRAAPAGPTAPSAELVLRDKADRVKAFYEGTSQARGSWRGAASGRTLTSAQARAAGRAEGQRADLGQPRLRQRGQLGA